MPMVTASSLNSERSEANVNVFSYRDVSGFGFRVWNAPKNEEKREALSLFALFCRPPRWAGLLSF